MIPALLVAAAVYIVAGPQIIDRLKNSVGSLPLPQLERKHVAGAALLAAAAIAWGSGRPATRPPSRP